MTSNKRSYNPLIQSELYDLNIWFSNDRSFFQKYHQFFPFFFLFVSRVNDISLADSSNILFLSLS